MTLAVPKKGETMVIDATTPEALKYRLPWTTGDHGAIALRSHRVRFALYAFGGLKLASPPPPS